MTDENGNPFSIQYLDIEIDKKDKCHVILETTLNYPEKKQKHHTQKVLEYIKMSLSFATFFLAKMYTFCFILQGLQGRKN